MSADSWQAFADALGEENRLLGELGSAALGLTSVLVSGAPAEIKAAERKVEAQRVLHSRAHAHRMTMMKRGFGALSLQQVCGYAPAPLRRTLYTTYHELTTRAIGLRITVSNNKSLILAGLQRVANTLAVIQKAMTEQPGTYKRRGIVPPTNGSVIVSRNA